MKDYKIERYGLKSAGKIALIEQCNLHPIRNISFIYWADHELPIEGDEYTVAFFRVKQRKRVSWWRRVFKRVRNIR